MSAVAEPIQETNRQQADPAQPETKASADETKRTNSEMRLLDAVVEESHRQQMEKLQYEEQRFSFQQRRAKLFAASGLFAVKDVSPEQAIAQAMVKIELGESMGFSPAESLQGIHIIQGVTAVAAALRAARMQARGWTWEIDWLGTEKECAGCRLWLYLNGKPLLKPKRNDKGVPVTDEQGNVIVEHVSVSYTRADAEKMLTTLWENGQKRRASILEKDNWKMSPRNMYFSRVVTNAQRWYDAGALSINLPSVEEVQDMDLDARNGREVMRASINLSQVKASTEQNRGHDQTVTGNPTEASSGTPAGTVSEASAPQPATGDASRVAAGNSSTDNGPQGFGLTPPSEKRRGKGGNQYTD